MTVINHKSISGITSITAPAGSDDLLTVHTNDTTERFRIVDSGAIVTGVTTASNFKTGTTNVHNVGVEAAGINVLGADTPIGTGATIYNSGAAVFTGIVTATNLNVESKVGIGTASPTEILDVRGDLVVAESLAVNRPRIVLSAPNDGTNYRHLFGANLQVNSSGTFTTPTANISGGGWEYLPANSLNAHGSIRYLSAPDTNATTSTPVERLRINANGDIVTQGLTDHSFNNDNANAKILEMTGDGTVGEYGSINVSGNQNADGSNIGSIKFVNRENSNSSSSSNAGSRVVAGLQAYIETSDTNAGDDSGGYLKFLTKSESGGLGERLRIKSDGTVYTYTEGAKFGVSQDPTLTTMGNTSGTWDLPEVDGQTIGAEMRIGDINSNSTALIRLASYGSGNSGTAGGAIMFTNTRCGSASHHSDLAAIKGARESLGKGYLRFFTASSAANTEKMRITSGGNVNIGGGSGDLTQTVYPLSVLGSTSGTGQINIVQRLKFSGNSNTYNTGTVIAFTNTTTNANAYSYIGARIDAGASGDNANALVFATNATNTAPTEKLRITSIGRVGINKDNPESLLHIDGVSNDPYIYLQRSGAGDAALDIGGIFWKNDTKLSALIKCRTIDRDDAELIFETMYQNSRAEKFRIKNDGRLMTQSAGFIYTSSSAGSLTLAGGNTNLGGKIVLTGGNGTGNIEFHAQQSTGTPAVRMTILGTTGRVGIWETNPTRALSVGGSVNIQSGERIESYSSGGSLIIQGGSTYPGGHMRMWGGSGDNMLTLNTSGAATSSIERLRIHSDGIPTIPLSPTAHGSINASALVNTSGRQPANNNQFQTNGTNNLSAGWYTIAACSSGRASGRIGIRDLASSRHQAVTFYAGHHYGGGTSQNCINTIFSSGRHSGNPLGALRIKAYGTYDGAMVQVYLRDGTNNCQAFLLGDNLQTQGWIMKNWVADGTDPGTVTQHTNIHNNMSTPGSYSDLHELQGGGMSSGGHIIPDADNRWTLGRSSYRWHEIFCMNSSNTTSDETLKQDIAALTTAEMNAAKRLSALFKTYRWKDAVTEKGTDKARIHTGIIAQQVKSAMEAESLDPAKYSFYCIDEWYEDSNETKLPLETATRQGDSVGVGTNTTLGGNIVVPTGFNKVTRYSIRYVELLAFISAYNEQRFASIESRLTALESS